MFIEKRLEKRLNINIPMAFKHPHKDSVYQTILHDISKKGIRVMSKVSIQNDKKIKFKIVFPQSNNTIVSSGYVAWVKPHRHENSFYEIGIKFNGLDEKHKTYINDFLKKHNLASS